MLLNEGWGEGGRSGRGAGEEGANRAPCGGTGLIADMLLFTLPCWNALYLVCLASLIALDWTLTE